VTKKVREKETHTTIALVHFKQKDYVYLINFIKPINYFQVLQLFLKTRKIYNIKSCTL